MRLSLIVRPAWSSRSAPRHSPARSRPRRRCRYRRRSPSRRCRRHGPNDQLIRAAIGIGAADLAAQSVNARNNAHGTVSYFRRFDMQVRCGTDLLSQRPAAPRNGHQPARRDSRHRNDGRRQRARRSRRHDRSGHHHRSAVAVARCARRRAPKQPIAPRSKSSTRSIRAEIPPVGSPGLTLGGFSCPRHSRP